MAFEGTGHVCEKACFLHNLMSALRAYNSLLFCSLTFVRT
jgi:hypothetical protein